MVSNKNAFEIVNIASQMVQKSYHAEIVSAKAFLMCACRDANPYLVLDSLTFIRFEYASK